MTSQKNRDFLPYGRQTLGKEERSAVEEVLGSPYITQGPQIEAFEEELAAFCGAKYAVAVSSGTAALHLATLGLRIDSKTSFFTSTLSFVASANCAVYAGVFPNLVDVEDSTGNIDLSKVEEAIEEKSLSLDGKVFLVPVHFSGRPCGFEGIERVRKSCSAIVLEDASHALGAEYQVDDFWHRVGSCQHSDAAVFSFHPVKSITTAEGGAVLTNSEELYEQVKFLRTHGIRKEKKQLKRKGQGDWFYEMQELGFNYRISDLHAALGRAQLRKLPSFIRERKDIATAYQELLLGHPGIICPEEDSLTRSSWHLMAIRLKGCSIPKKKMIFQELRSRGVGVQVHYIPIHYHPFYQDNFGYRDGQFPVAEKVYEEVLSLPIFPGLSQEDINYVCENLISIWDDFSSR